MCTETDHHCFRADMLNPPLEALKSSSVPVPVWAHLTARMASYDLPVRHTCTLRKPVLVSMRVYSDGGRSRPSACTSMLREKIWAMTGPRRFSNSMASTSRTPPPDGTTDKDTEYWEGVKVFREVDLVRFIFLFWITGGRARTQTHLLSKTHLVRRCCRSSSAASGTSLQASREWFWPERRDRQEGFHRRRNLLKTRQKSSDSFRQRQSRCSYWTNRLMRLFCITVTQKQHKFNVINFIKLFISGWIRGSPVWNATASFSWEKCFWAVSTTCGRSNTVTEEEGYAFAISRARAPVHPGSYSNRTTWKQEFTVFSVKSHRGNVLPTDLRNKSLFSFYIWLFPCCQMQTRMFPHT